MTKDPNGERSALKRNKPLPKDEHLPLRQYFLEGKDDVILKIILNCFSALKVIFPDEWKILIGTYYGRLQDLEA